MLDMLKGISKPKFDIDVIIEAVVIFLLVAISMIVIGPFTSVTGGDAREETFTVTDDTVDQSLDIDYDPVDNVVTVQKYNASGWSSVSSTYYSYANGVVTVQHEGI